MFGSENRYTEVAKLPVSHHFVIFLWVEDENVRRLEVQVGLYRRYVEGVSGLTSVGRSKP